MPRRHWPGGPHESLIGFMTAVEEVSTHHFRLSTDLESSGRTWDSSFDLARGKKAQQNMSSSGGPADWQEEVNDGMSSLAICQGEREERSAGNSLLDSMSHLDAAQQKKLYERLKQYESLFLHGSEMPAAARGDAVARIQSGGNSEDIVAEASYRATP